MRKLDIYAAYWAMSTNTSFEEAKEGFERSCALNPSIRRKMDGEISQEEGLRLLEALIDGTGETPLL